jgi:hypothetical protein
MDHDFLLLDRSGSMDGSIWGEALNSINAYAKKLADDNVDTGITVVIFDSVNTFQIIRDRITPKTFRPLVSGESLDAEGKDKLTPRGGTPLNDATGKLLDLAQNGSPSGSKYEKVAIVIMTDGEENASQEYPIKTGGTEKIKARLDGVREKGWQVIYLGANFDNQRQSQTYGAAAAQSIQTSAANFKGTMRSMAEKRTSYGLTGQTMSWSDEEKKKAKSDT